MLDLFGAFGGFRFVVITSKAEFTLFSAFTECVLPNLEVKTDPIEEGGQNTYIHKLPKRVEVGTITLKKGLTPHVAFIDWYMLVVEGKVEDAMQEVIISVRNPLGLGVATWFLHKAYPIKWRGPSLKAGDSAIAIEELELVHHGFEVGPSWI
jgi:phage tail-like protein